MKQWADGTMAFYLPPSLWLNSKLACISASLACYQDVFPLFCNHPFSLNILCEFDSAPQGFIASIRSSLSFPFPYIICSGNHVTHTFLACEENCYGDSMFMESEKWGVPEPTSCHAPLTSLPPLFLCNNGGQRVPYSVLCDFRSDCTDSSDEDFCTFLQCIANIQRSCGSSKQVTSS